MDRNEISERRAELKTRRRRRSGAPLAEEGDGGEDGEREEVAVDAEDDLVHAHVEDGLGEDLVTAVGELDEDHPGVRPPGALVVRRQGAQKPRPEQRRRRPVSLLPHLRSPLRL